jgi:hypothetical protein
MRLKSETARLGAARPAYVSAERLTCRDSFRFYPYGIVASITFAPEDGDVGQALWRRQVRRVGSRATWNCASGATQLFYYGAPLRLPAMSATKAYVTDGFVCRMAIAGSYTHIERAPVETAISNGCRHPCRKPMVASARVHLRRRPVPIRPSPPTNIRAEPGSGTEELKFPADTSLGTSRNESALPLK